jgi:hypothetical protein
MSATYNKSSLYYGTQTWGPFLDVWRYNTLTIPENVDDALYQIDPAYHLRPDLLAYDMYKNSDLWWVFSVRNPDTLLDPLMDFTKGTIIYVPSLATINKAIGY